MIIRPNPKNLAIMTRCPSCGGTQGLFHLVEGGTLVLGRQACEQCGAVEKTDTLTPMFGWGGPPEVQTRVEVDADIHHWPQTNS